MFTLTTDTSIDIFRSKLKELDVPYIPLCYTTGTEQHIDNLDSDEEAEAFYASLKTGKLPVTSQINPAEHEDFFEKVYSERKTDIVHLTLSGGLSQTHDSAVSAAQSFMKKHPKVQVCVVDTLAATVAMWPLFEKALVMRDDGTSASSAAEALRAYTLRIQAYIIPDDLFHLKRGGRVSAAAAAVGTVFQIKPVIVFDNKGRLSVYKKAVGFNRALKIVLDHIERFCPLPADKKIWVADAAAHEQAQMAKKAIEERFGSSVTVGWIGPVIGAHTGSGTIGIVFESASRLL